MKLQPARSALGGSRSELYLASAATALTIFAWASAFPLIRIALDQFEPLPLAAARFSLAAIVAGVWLLAVKPVPPSPKDLAAFAACGLTGIFLYNGLLNTGQQTVSAGAASFLVNTGPIITALLATVFLKERFGAAAWAGSAVAFAGVAIIAYGQPGGLLLGAGASFVLAAAACQASYFILQRPLVPRYGALTSTAYTIIAGALLLTPWLPAALGSVIDAEDSQAAVLAVIALAVLPSVIGYAAWTYALGVFGAARASNFLYLVPPMAMIIAFGLTGELPSLTTLAGGALAIAGVVIVNLRARRGKI